MSKIVIDARESGTSTGRYIDKLIEHLHILQPTESFSLITKPHRISYLKAVAPNFTCIETTAKEFTFDEQLGFKKQLEDLKADLVHFGMAQQPIRYRGKTITTIHDLTTVRFINPDKNRLVYTTKQQVYKHVVKQAVKKADFVIAISEYVKQDLLNFSAVAESKIQVIYEAADKITESPTPFRDLHNSDFIMYVGRPTPHKNLERLIQAFEQLHLKHPSLKLVLAGKKDANYSRIATTIPPKLAAQVLFTGYVSDGQLRWLYEHCAAYVFPSLSEGFGLPGLEAMMHGAAVVSSDATCLPEIYGSAARYFNPTDIAAMTESIEAVISNLKLRKSLIEAGSEQVAHYSWERTAQQTLELYRRSLAI